jgi:hypothetical protein
VTDDTGGGFREFKPYPDADPIAELVERIKVNITVAYEKASMRHWRS